MTTAWIIELFFGIVALMICWKAKVGIVGRFVAGFAAMLMLGLGLKDMSHDPFFWLIAGIAVFLTMTVIAIGILRSRRKRAEQRARDEAYWRHSPNGYAPRNY